jgi:hypothetical protein
MTMSRFTPAQRRALANDPATCDLRTARVLQQAGLLGPADRVSDNRRLVTARLMSGPRLPDGAMRR